MKAIFVNENEKAYAYEIVESTKLVETRTKNMLSACIGERVAIVSTKRHCHPLVIGYVDVVKAEKHGREWLNANRKLTCIPHGSKYDTGERWCYFLSNAQKLEHPYLLPSSAIRHGRSWCEW